jgi:hypothetical protein
MNTKGIMLVWFFVANACMVMFINAQPLTPAEKEFALIMRGRLNDMLRQHVVRDFDGTVVRIIPFKKSIDRRSADTLVGHLQNYAQRDDQLPELRDVEKMKVLLEKVPVEGGEREIARTERFVESPSAEIVVNENVESDFKRYVQNLKNICKFSMSDDFLKRGIDLAFAMVKAGTRMKSDNTAVIVLLQELNGAYVDCINDQNESDYSVIQQQYAQLFNQRRKWCELFWHQLLGKIKNPLFWDAQKDQAQNLLLRIVNEIMDFCSAQDDGDNQLLVGDVREIAQTVQGTQDTTLGQKQFFSNVATIFGTMVDAEKSKDIIREFVPEDKRKDWNNSMEAAFDELSQYSPEQVGALISVAVNSVTDNAQKGNVKVALEKQYHSALQRREFFGSHGKNVVIKSIVESAGDNVNDDQSEASVESAIEQGEGGQSEQESVGKETEEQRLNTWNNKINEIKASKDKSQDAQNILLSPMHDYAIDVMKVAENKSEMLNKLKDDFAQAVKEIMQESDSNQWIENFNNELSKDLISAKIIVQKHGG